MFTVVEAWRKNVDSAGALLIDWASLSLVSGISSVLDFLRALDFAVAFS